MADGPPREDPSRRRASFDETPTHAGRARSKERGNAASRRHDRARASEARLAVRRTHLATPSFPSFESRVGRPGRRRGARLAQNPPGFSSLATCAASDARERFSGGAVDLPLVTQDDTAHVEAALRGRGGFAKRGRGQRRERGSGRWIRESARRLTETLNDTRPSRHGNGRRWPRARSEGLRTRMESVTMTLTEWIRRP